MSTNKPNWVDYANLAANFASLASNLTQNVQLQRIHSTLSTLASIQAEMARMDANKAQVAEREDRLREHLWNMERNFDEAIRIGGIAPCNQYLIARQIQDGLGQCGIASTSFRQFCDKDRLGAFADRLLQIINTSATSMTEDQRKDADTFLRYQVEVAELESSIKREREYGAKDDDLDDRDDWMQQTQELRGVLESKPDRDKDDEEFIEHLLMIEKYQARGIPHFQRHKAEREAFLLEFRQANNV
jgi:hypothetical protein